MKTKDITNDALIEQTIVEVMKKMKPTMNLSGYSESTIRKIEQMWRKNLLKEPKTEFANLSRVIKERIVKPQVLLEVKKESPVLKAPSPESQKFSENEDESLDDYKDPALEEFEETKRENEEAEKKKEMKEEEKESPLSDDIFVSDDDTKLDDPVADVYIHALYDNVKRKKTKWTAVLQPCVLQRQGKHEMYFKYAQCTFNSTKTDNH
jgi:hypothetical protein